MQLERGNVAKVSVRKGFFLFSALVVAGALVGCGGSQNAGGSTGGTGGGGGGGNTRSRPTIVLGNSASLQTVYLSGEDRRGRGTNQVAAISQVRYANGLTDVVPDGSQTTLNEVRVKLDAYTMNTFRYAVGFNGEKSRGFSQHPFEIARMYEVQPDGSLQPLTGAGSIAFTPAVPFDVNVRVFPGRTSTLTMRVDDAMITYSNTLGRVVFNSDLFITTNYSPVYNSITSSFSDYVAFDISGLANSERPTITNSGNPAEMVYFSGDGIAISEGMGEVSIFELLDPVAIKSGKVSTGPLIGPTGQQQQGANLFVLDDEDPSATKVTSLVGTWKPFSDVIIPNGAVTAVAFPSSRETNSTTDIEEQQFVVFSTSGGNITAMWQGQVFYNTGGDPTKGTFRLFPVDTIDDAVPSNQISGTVTNLVLSNDGFVMSGDWDVVGVPPGNWPFPTSGGFSVFRK